MPEFAEGGNEKYSEGGDDNNSVLDEIVDSFVESLTSLKHPTTERVFRCCN
jgi:hypothetical protein